MCISELLFLIINDVRKMKFNNKYKRYREEKNQIMTDENNALKEKEQVKKAKSVSKTTEKRKNTTRKNRK